MTHSLRSAALLGCLTACLAGCGGSGGASSSLPAGPGPALTHGKASISFFVPVGPSSGKRRRNLPAGTQSVSVTVLNADGSAVTPAIAPVVQNVSASASGCASVTGGFECTVQIAVPFGSYLFDAVTYAGQNATGAVLTQGTSAATISATSAQTVNIATSSLLNYETLDLSGDVEAVAIDHAADTITVNTSGGTVVGSYTVLPQGDLKMTVTSVVGSGSAVGEISYVREIPGVFLTYLATQSASPPVTGVVSSDGDWGVGTTMTACPTASTTFALAAVSLAGQTFVADEATANAAVTGTVAVTGSATTASYAFTGTGYLLTGAQSGTPQNGNGTCANSVFNGTGNNSGNGNVAYGNLGVVIVGNGSQESASDSNGGYGFDFRTVPVPSVATVTSVNYEGYLGSASQSGGSPIVATGNGAGSLQGCEYANYEQDQPGTQCATIALNATQPIPGLLFGTLTEGAPSGVGTVTIPLAATAEQIGGKWVIFAITQDGENLAMTQQ